MVEKYLLSDGSYFDERREARQEEPVEEVQLKEILQDREAGVCTCKYAPSGKLQKVRTQFGSDATSIKTGYKLVDRSCPACGQWSVHAEQLGLPQGFKRWICKECAHVLSHHETKERGMLREQIYLVEAAKMRSFGS